MNGSDEAVFNDDTTDVPVRRVPYRGELFQVESDGAELGIILSHRHPSHTRSVDERLARVLTGSEIFIPHRVYFE